MHKISFVVLWTALSAAWLHGQVQITLPAVPDTQAVRPFWQGYNQAATTQMDWMRAVNAPAYISGLKPGIIRWPFGNRANNYRWQAHLQDTQLLNFPNAIDYYWKQRSVPLQMVVNFGNGTPSEAAEWVRFCNDTTPPYRAARDSLLGDAAALRFQLWEIGNESTDPWTYAWSWLGHQDAVFGYQGVVIDSPTRLHADSLYYYGGSLWRRGWVEVIGGLTPITAILGHLKAYTASRNADTIAVAFPFLDTSDPAGVRVYLTRNVDFQWAQQQTNPGALYDSIARPANLLPAGDYSWDSVRVFLHPVGGLQPYDVVLIEYHSVGHAGAFAFRDAMKAADPTIKVGYTVKITPELSALPGFAADFAAHPPDFMVVHQYASKLTKPMLDSGYYRPAAYTAQFKVGQLKSLSREWEDRSAQWGLPDTLPLSLTEWNIALCDDCPNPHPFDGIAGGLYVADFWARMVQEALRDSLHLLAADHFGLMATGNNFIHLIHIRESNGGPDTAYLGAEGIAMTLTMAALGEAVFAPQVSTMPSMTIPWGEKNNWTTLTVDALTIYGGMAQNGKTISLLLINRDTAAHSATIHIPIGWQADSLLTASLTGATNHRVTLAQNKAAFTGTSHTWTLPAYSVNLWQLSLSSPVTSLPRTRPHPAPLRIATEPGRVRILNDRSGILRVFNMQGQEILHRRYTDDFSTAGWPTGPYLIQLISPDEVRTARFFRQ